MPWHTALQLVVSALNASFNNATKCAPFKVVFGHDGFIGLPDLNRLRAEKASESSLLINGTLREIHDFVRISNEAVDHNYRNKANKGRTRKALEIGDICALFRPLAVAANKKEQWVGEYKVIESNEYVTNVLNLANNRYQIVANNHLRCIDERPERLKVPDNDCAQNESTPVTPPVESKGGEPEQAVAESTSSSPVSSSITPAAPEPRRSSRQRTTPSTLNIASTSGKAYSAIRPTSRPSYRNALVMGQ